MITPRLSPPYLGVSAPTVISRLTHHSILVGGFIPLLSPDREIVIKCLLSSRGRWKIKNLIAMILRKDQLEASLHEEKKLIETGRLKEDNPLDLSASFAKLCEACRRGDLKVCQEMITEGANINARDQFDYTPLILVGNMPQAISKI